MPPAIGKPCASPGCSAIVTSGSRCDEHRRKVEADDRRWRGTATERGYNSKWHRYRSVYLAANPLCVSCLTRNRVVPAAQIDHVRPRSKWPQLFWEPLNHQPLCRKCHERKSAAEQNGLIYSAPMDLGKPAIKPTLVHGPPGSGKTTLAQQHAGSDDIIIDLDVIKAKLSRVPMYQALDAITGEALEERNRQLQALRRSAKKAWFIVSAPTAQERYYWQQVLDPSRVYVLAGGCITRQECKRRIALDERRSAIAPRFSNPVDGWFAAYEATAGSEPRGGRGGSNL